MEHRCFTASGRLCMQRRCVLCSYPLAASNRSCRSHTQPTVGFIVAAFKPAVPPTIPTPDAVWEGLVATGADFSWSVPSFIEVGSSKHQVCAKVLKAMAGMVPGP